MMIRIGAICPSEIAFRRFMPAIKKAGDIILKQEHLIQQFRDLCAL